ncbi:hypothetical protein KL918_005026 [Ogataea parapolymorpha]|nr:hypothetical protein KL918_005026 [Ogataea parapolymorpha]KAG7871598.1 hypothetical protein KL916_003949 [Ogataea parapolymorpha]
MRFCHELSVAVIRIFGGILLRPTLFQLEGVISRFRRDEPNSRNARGPRCSGSACCCLGGFYEFPELQGLMLEPDPGPGAIVGGILATNAPGANALRFGSAKDDCA